MKNEKTPLAQFIFAKRKSLQLTQNEVAKKLGMTQKGYSEYECKGRIPKNSILREIAGVLSVDIFDLEDLIIDPTDSKIGKFIRIKRRIKNMTLVELAKKLKYTKKKLLDIETGKETLTVKKIQRFMKVLECRFEDFQKCGVPVLKSVSAFGKMIREKRVTLDLSQEDVAHKLGLTRAAVSLFETENKPRISEDVLERLCLVLEMDIKDVMSYLPNKRIIKENVKQFGVCIRILRKAKGMFQSELAKKIGISSASVSNIEKGCYSSISVELLEKFSFALGCKKEDLESSDFDRISKLCEDLKRQESQKIKQFRECLIALRTLKNLSQKEFSKKVKISFNVVRSIESGKVQKIRKEWIDKISKHFDCDKEILINTDIEKVRKITRQTSECKNPETLGAFVKAKRTEMGWEIEALSKKAKISKPTIKVIENDQFKKLLFQTIEKLAKALKCEVDILRSFLDEECEKPTSLAAYIKNLRMQKGLTQKKLAKKAKVHYKTICDIEHGKVRNAKNKTLKKIAGVLGCKIDALKAFNKNKDI